MNGAVSVSRVTRPGNQPFIDQGRGALHRVADRVGSPVALPADNPSWPTHRSVLCVCRTRPEGDKPPATSTNTSDRVVARARGRKAAVNVSPPSVHEGRRRPRPASGIPASPTNVDRRVSQAIVPRETRPDPSRHAAFQRCLLRRPARRSVTALQVAQRICRLRVRQCEGSSPKQLDTDWVDTPFSGRTGRSSLWGKEEGPRAEAPGPSSDVRATH